MQLAFNFSSRFGVPEAIDVAYQNRQQTCDMSKAVALRSSGFEQIRANSASALESALANGPVAVVVASDNWRLYSGGIFDSGCSKDRSCTMNHGVIADGYDRKHGYWLLRNSWGRLWGESGYIRLTRKKDHMLFENNKPEDGSACKPYPKKEIVGGECGILFDGTYPRDVVAVRADSKMV